MNITSNCELSTAYYLSLVWLFITLCSCQLSLFFLLILFSLDKNASTHNEELKAPNQCLTKTIKCNFSSIYSFNLCTIIICIFL